MEENWVGEMGGSSFSSSLATRNLPDLPRVGTVLCVMLAFEARAKWKRVNEVKLRVCLLTSPRGGLQMKGRVRVRKRVVPRVGQATRWVEDRR